MSVPMNNEKLLVILRAYQKVLKNAADNVAADVKSELWERNEGNGTSDDVYIGDVRAKVTLEAPSVGKELVGQGEEFEEFMREHGMVIEVIDERWTQCVVQAGGKVLWEETGELVPGVYVQVTEKAQAVKVYNPNPRETLFAAREAGLLEATTIHLLED